MCFSLVIQSCNSGTLSEGESVPLKHIGSAHTGYNCAMFIIVTDNDIIILFVDRMCGRSLFQCHKLQNFVFPSNTITID